MNKRVLESLERVGEKCEMGLWRTVGHFGRVKSRKRGFSSEKGRDMDANEGAF